MTNAAIHTEGLIKKFGSFTALNELNLLVERGEVHGFLGPNGAGKSTTIRVLLGLLKANGGTVELLGGDPWKDAVELHKKLAYVPGDVTLWPGLSGGEAIDLLGNLRGGLDRTRRAEIIERFELDPTKRGRQYSKGNRQKVALIAALASDAELLILDEPTSGLDPLMEAIFQDEIAKVKAQGRTVLLSSHILSEVEALGDRVSIIRSGQIVQTGTLDELRGQTRSQLAVYLINPPVSPENLPGLADARIDSRGKLTASIDPNQVDDVVRALLPFGMRDLTITPASLEELFLNQYTVEA